MTRSILTYWSNPNWDMRDGQRYILEQAQSKSWDILVIVAPTSLGKTNIGSTILPWLGRGAYLTPTNMLVDQFLASHPKWATVRRKSQYNCKDYQTSCNMTKKNLGKHCRGCTYVKDLRRIRACPHKILTYYMYMAHKLRDENLVMDEAHTLIPTIRALEAKQIWRHEVNYPSNLRTIGDLRGWLAQCPGFDAGFPNDPKLGLLQAELENAGEHRFLIEKTTDLWRNEERELIKLLPLDISKAKPYIWPRAKRIVLMSATIGPKDIEQLGLDKRRVHYVEAPSPIEPKRRPIYIRPLGSFSYKAGGATLPKLVQMIKQMMDKYKHAKGLVHLTYGMSKTLRPYLNDPKILWHDSQNKTKVYKRWTDMDPSSGAVLMACGMYEGLDLIHDLGRWQIISKVPWPSLADPAIAHKAEEDPEWYEWEALKMVIQAAGRICRSPDDFGETVITDSSFFRINESLYPNFFKEALVKP